MVVFRGVGVTWMYTTVHNQPYTPNRTESKSKMTDLWTEKASHEKCTNASSHCLSIHWAPPTTSGKAHTMDFLSTVNINTVSQVLVNSELTPCFWRQWSCPLSLAKLFQSYCVHYSLDVYCVYFDAKTQKLVQLEEMHGSILLRIKPIARINLGDVKTLQNLETFRCLYLETSCFTSFSFPLYPSQLNAYGLVILKHKNYLVRLWKR